MFKPINGKIIPEGWMREFLLRDKDGITGNLGNLYKDCTSGIFAENKVDHKTDGVWSSWWPGECEGNWRDAYVRLAFLIDDESMKQNATEYVNSVLENQDQDGYIGIYKTIDRYKNGSRSGELWTQSRIMNVLLAYYQSTGDKNVWRALELMTDLTVTKFGPLANNRSYFDIPDEDGSKAHGLMIIEPILFLYEKLKKPEYLEFCEFLFQDFSRHATKAKFPCYDVSFEMATDPLVPLVGHGPHTCEHLRIPVLLYKVTGKKIYHSIFVSVFEKIKKNMSLSGSCKSDELIGAYQGNIAKSKSNTRRDFEYFNIDKSYPLPTAGFEYCSSTELMISLIAAMQSLDKMEYADFEEWLVMNAAMSARRQDGKAILYLCADNLYEATKEIGARWDYSPTHDDAAVCCAPNAARLMPYHLSNMWQIKDDNSLLAAFYGPCTLVTTIDGSNVMIKQNTNYPFTLEVNMTIEADYNFDTTINFRIPNWSTDTELMYNGKPINGKVVKDGNGRYISLKRTFKNKDSIHLNFKTKPKVRKAIDNTVSVAYGPLLYALDIPAVAEDYFHYDLKPFCDTNYKPKEDANWEYTLLYNENSPEDFLRVEQKNKTGFVWDESPITIEAMMLSPWAIPEWKKLMPIGCTILRRTTFPFVIE